MLLFVGLGNPTPDSKNNRHNIGFKIIDNILFTVFGKPKKEINRQRKLILSTELVVNTGTVLVDVMLLCWGFIPLGGNFG